MHTRKEDGTMTRVLLKDRLAHKLTRAIASGLYPVGTLLPGTDEAGSGLAVHGAGGARAA